MGIAERRLREKARRRETILKAARKLVVKHGVEGMSMSQLAAATELNKATLYLYFQDKDDLIDAIVYEGLVALDGELGKIDRRGLSGREQIRKIVEGFFSFWRRSPLYFYTMNHQERRRESERIATPFAAKGDEAASRIFEKMAASTRQGIEDGSVRRDIDIPAFMVLLYAQIYGVMHTVHAKEDIYRDVFGLDAAAIERSALESIECYVKTGREGGARTGKER